MNRGVVDPDRDEKNYNRKKGENGKCERENEKEN